MEKIKVVIVEDKALIAESLKATLTKHDMEVTGVFDNGEDVLATIETELPDLILMDIQLAGAMDGISTAKVISDKYSLPIIYLTDFEDEGTVQRAIKTKPANYLGKPFNETQLVRAINIAFASFNDTGKPKKGILQNHIFIRVENVYKKIAIDDIVYLEANGAYCNLYTEDQKFLQCISMNHVLEQLNHPHFIRVHRSSVINANKVTELEGNQVRLGKHTVEMSRSLREKLLPHVRFLK